MNCNKFVLLLYHGVTRSSHLGIENCSRKHIRADDFQRQIEYLSNHYMVLPLSVLLERRRDGILSDRTVAITFDDGFENNFTIAFPILRHYNVPATFFLATGFIGVTRVFWADKIEYLLNESPLLTLYLESLGQEFDLSSTSEKKESLQVIKHRLKETSGLVNDVVSELERESQTAPKYAYKDYRTLTWDQVREMHRSGLCEFGAHTVDHLILGQISTQDKKYQILESRHKLEKELGERVDLFSYPEGQSTHFDHETIQIIKDSGFSASPTAMFGVNNSTTSEYYLRRNMVEFSAPFDKCLEVLDVDSC